MRVQASALAIVALAASSNAFAPSSGIVRKNVLKSALVEQFELGSIEDAVSLSTFGWCVDCLSQLSVMVILSSSESSNNGCSSGPLIVFFYRFVCFVRSNTSPARLTQNLPGDLVALLERM
jgi:hypothetical protein